MNSGHLYCKEKQLPSPYKRLLSALILLAQSNPRTLTDMYIYIYTQVPLHVHLIHVTPVTLYPLTKYDRSPMCICLLLPTLLLCHTQSPNVSLPKEQKHSQQTTLIYFYNPLMRGSMCILQRIGLHSCIYQQFV